MNKKILIPLIIVGIVSSSAIASYFLFVKEDKSIMENEVKIAKCIIQINDAKYDVSEFKSMHKGGDIFKCGENMTKEFYGKHGDKMLPKIEKYKL